MVPQDQELAIEFESQQPDVTIIGDYPEPEAVSDLALACLAEARLRYGHIIAQLNAATWAAVYRAQLAERLAERRRLRRLRRIRYHRSLARYTGRHVQVVFGLIARRGIGTVLNAHTGVPPREGCNKAYHATGAQAQVSPKQSGACSDCTSAATDCTSAATDCVSSNGLHVSSDGLHVSSNRLHVSSERLHVSSEER